jgi:predicted phage terminase large subunit-like protein
MTDVVFPVGTDAVEVLRPLFHGAWSHTGKAGREYRIDITREDPLLFAITYFGHYLRGPDGGMSFNAMHLALCESAKTWTGGDQRDAWVAPREAGKSVWLFVILPLWALAHGHRRFFLAFSATRAQANGHLANLRAELKNNGRLLADFPELTPTRGQNSADFVVTQGGAAVAARGMTETSLGARSGEQRPDLLVGDDMEPPEADYGPDTRENTLSRLVNAILPMNTRAAVAITGTVVTYGSVMHDVVLAALGQRHDAWLDDEGFTPHWFPAIQVDEHGEESSLWPQRWSLEWLRERRGTASYALNYDNNPSPKGSQVYWTPESIPYDARIPVVRRVVYIDPATTTKASSDYTAIVMIGIDASGRRVVVEHAVAGHWDGGEIREQVWELKRLHPASVGELVLEVNQGGEAWRRALAPLPPGISFREVHSRQEKGSRIRDAAEDYRRFAVVHAHTLPALEAQMLAYPRVRNDDLVDALAGALAHVFAEARALL